MTKSATMDRGDILNKMWPERMVEFLNRSVNLKHQYKDDPDGYQKVRARALDEFAAKADLIVDQYRAANS